MKAFIHTSSFLFAAGLALSVSQVACHNSQAAAAMAEPEAPAGEVWLTPAQMKDAKIEVAPIAPRNVDDTILTSGTITLDDLRTGHVFSPVTGRVVKIAATLGQHVKRRAPRLHRVA